MGSCIQIAQNFISVGDKVTIDGCNILYTVVDNCKIVFVDYKEKFDKKKRKPHYRNIGNRRERRWK